MNKTANPEHASTNPLAGSLTRAAGANLAQALNDGVTDKRLAILRGVAQTGSISESARQAKVSYKSAWQAIETLSRLANAVLVEKSVGGMGGGGARLTKAGEGLLQAAERWQQLQRHWFVHQQMPPIGLRMQTSMRNQWPVSVQSCVPSKGRVRVALSLGDEQRLWAQITPESQQQLGIELGTEVLAMCKANAVGVKRLGVERPSVKPLRAREAVSATGKVNRFEGRLNEMGPQAVLNTGDPVTAILASGLILTGYWRDTVLYSSEDGGEGEAVSIEIDESAVVIAIAR